MLGETPKPSLPHLRNPEYMRALKKQVPVSLGHRFCFKMTSRTRAKDSLKDWVKGQIV